MISVKLVVKEVLVEVKCEVCGKTFEKENHRVNRTKSGKHYCSRECYQQQPISTQEKTGDEVECAYCGSMIYRSGYYIKHSKNGLFFCDKSCTAKYRSKIINDDKNVICDNCGKPFRKSPSTIRDTNFCCRNCWKEFIKSNGPVYYRKFKGDVCEKCGFVPEDKCQLDVHHDDGDKLNNTEDNLITLCANCHRLVHYLEQQQLISEKIDDTCDLAT